MSSKHTCICKDLLWIVSFPCAACRYDQALEGYTKALHLNPSLVLVKVCNRSVVWAMLLVCVHVCVCVCGEEGRGRENTNRNISRVVCPRMGTFVCFMDCVILFACIV